MRKKYLRSAYYKLLILRRLNLLATLWLNFRTLPFLRAIKLPIFCFGKIMFHNLSGRIIIDSPIKTGMIKFGYRWYDLWPSSYLPSQIFVRGDIIFMGRCIFSGGVVLSSFNKQAEIIIGNNVAIGGGTMVKSTQSISIGANTSITGNCVVMDSNMHYVKDIESGIIPSLRKGILIGKNCWINHGTTIAKGAVLCDHSITARNTYVGKDMSQFGSHVLFAGQPAKPIKTNVQRIFDLKKEKEISLYFQGDRGRSVYQSYPGIEIENEDLIHLIY